MYNYEKHQNYYKIIETCKSLMIKSDTKKRKRIYLIIAYKYYDKLYKGDVLLTSAQKDNIDLMMYYMRENIKKIER